MTWPGLRQAASRIGPTAVFALLPSLLLTVMLAGSVQHHFAFDFHQFWEGGRDVIEGN
ncbi:MAG: hypothetical protein QOD85_897, partial [Gaiellaceae bacterium]|nr:hypothetical protein [Gaiellaceae bacterium]